MKGDKMKELLCINCQKIVAKYTGKIEGITTWFSICSECLYGVKGWTEKDMHKYRRKR